MCSVCIACAEADRQHIGTRRRVPPIMQLQNTQGESDAAATGHLQCTQDCRSADAPESFCLWHGNLATTPLWLPQQRRAGHEHS